MERFDVSTFIFRREWIQNINSLPIEQQDKIISDMVRYGCQLDTIYTDDPLVETYVNFVKGSIDKNIDDYFLKNQMSQTAGRKKKVNDREIYELAQKGKSAAQIAELLECSKSSIDHSEGWKKRKEENVQF